jgi:CheY-like chemotaxis protein
MIISQASDDGQASGPPENPNRRSKLPRFSRIASRATRALNAVPWLHLGFFMDLFPPVTSVPSRKSTCARVRKTGATSLTKAHDRRYSLFIVDVEMPGMDGFEFVAQTRSDPALRDIPAIMVTSRNAVEDRRRGEQVGARAYIVKGEFDQEQLLQSIRTLIG